MDGLWAPISTAILLAVLFQKKCCKTYATFFVKKNNKKLKNKLPTERNNIFSDYFQVPLFWKVFHGERESEIVGFVWLHLAIWLPVALGVGDLYTKEY